MNLEQQLAEMAQVGLSLDAGVTIDDLLVSRDRGDYERIPFRHLLHALGSETEGASRGRTICRCAWTFDTECIVDAGNYVPIVNRLAAMAGANHRLRDVHVEACGADTALRYTFNDQVRRLPIEIVDDWADLRALCVIMTEFASSERRFYGQAEGQGVYLFYLSESGAARVNALAEGHMVLSSMADWVHDAAPTRTKRARKDDSQGTDDPAALANAITNYVGDAESRAIVSYDISKRFAVDDQVSHPVFGVGIVVRSEHTQIGVLFGEGLRMLAHGRNARR